MILARTKISRQDGAQAVAILIGRTAAARNVLSQTSWRRDQDKKALPQDFEIVRPATL